MSGVLSFGGLGRGAYALAIGLCTAVLGVMLGFFLCEFAFSAGVLKVDANIDDDMALTVMGWAMAGGLAGLVTGLVFGWRVISGKGRG